MNADHRMSDAIEMPRSFAQALARIGRALTDARDPEEPLSVLVDVAVAEFAADGAAVLRVADDGRLRVTTSVNLPQHMLAWTTDGDAFGEELAERMVGAARDGYVRAEAFPLVADGNIYGVLVLLARSPRDGEPQAIEFVHGLVDLAAVAIGRAVQYAALEKAYRELETSREALVREVDQRARAESEVRRQHDFNQRLIDNAEAIVLLRDLEGRVILYNSYLERALGVPLADAVGASWNDRFVAAGDRKDSWETFRRVLAEGEAVGYANRLLARDGGCRDVEWRTALLRDGSGATVLSVGHDVTERNLAEARLRELERLAQERERLADIGAISAQIAHDLGNPLSAVSMQAQMILHRGRRQPDAPLTAVMKPAEQLVSEVRRLEGLLREFLTFARGQRLDIRRFEVGAMLLAVVDLWQPVGTAHGIALYCDVSDGSLEVDADEDKLRRVLDNLVKNAIEAIGEGPGEVRLVASVAPAGRLRISVDDSGPGVSESIEPFRLFETTKKSGTGLGLAIAKQIMLAHGGDLTFARREPHGTSFRADLPLRRAAGG